ncbi:ATP-dependent protease La [Kwoniella sp. CBS 9459]
MTTPLLPSSIPLIPLPKPNLLYPHLPASIPLSSVQLGLVLDAVSRNLGGKGGNGERRVVGVVPVLEGDRRVGRWACAARIKGVEKADEADMYLLLVEGLCRIRLPRSLPPVLSLLPNIPPPTSPFSLPLPPLSTPSTDLLPYVTKLLPPALHSRLSSLPQSLLADLLVTVLGVDWETRVELLGVPDPELRCQKVKGILIELMVSRGVTPPVEQDQYGDPDTKRSLGRSPSTALIPRPRPSSLISSRSTPTSNSLASIPEDLRPLYTMLHNQQQTLSSAAKETVMRELARLIKIPPQSAEFGVSKTYIEWLLALPWKKVTETPHELDLARARAMLDDEHEGLEGVKKRVIEYLAVYRLKKRLFLEQQEKQQEKLETASTTAQKSDDLDPEVEKNLLALVPAAEREGLISEDRQSARDDEGKGSSDDGPPDDVFRDKGPILLLLGPPGVGKTSIARSLATSLGRKFYRISLGGVRDEAEIRGHRRTYVGALPGLLVQAMRKVGVANPLILLDELDKVGHSSFHGDPSAALLEALDPAQNWNFHDHYLGDVPIDLSQVLFIATANSTENMSWPLLDRCEVIHCSGYITPEKLKIARRFLLPKQIKESGLSVSHVDVGDDVLGKVITEYTREAGVRTLERQLGKLCRTKAVEYSASRESETSPVQGQSENSSSEYDPFISLEDVEKILGIPKYTHQKDEGPVRPGVVNGLSYTGSGNGGVLVIETLLVPGGHGKLVTTGRLGDVFRESVEICLTWVKSRAMSLGITTSATQHPLKDVDVHYHIPEGAVPKDGPSAGIATVLAFISLLTGREVDPCIAVTGEMSLRGTVLRIGGVKEKVIGAHRAGITKIILPALNRGDVREDVPEQVKNDIEFVFVEKIEQAIEEVWGKEIWASGSDSDSGSGSPAGSKSKSASRSRVEARL